MAVARLKAETLAPLPGYTPEQYVPPVPRYLEEVYWWAYMRPGSLAVFDHSAVVSAILWGNYGRLKRIVFDEIEPGQNVLQAACVYGDLCPRLAQIIGETGWLDIVDIVPLQVENCNRKLMPFPWSRARIADAALPGGARYDAVCCYFLLHELPDNHKRSVVDALLDSVAPGGRAIFVDYHRPHALHPLRPVMALVFALLEPFARRMWRSEIESFSARGDDFVWRKETYFGGLYQKVVAERRP